MAEPTKKDDAPKTATIKLTGFTGGGAHLLKDMGPNGGRAPDNAVQPNAFEPEDEYQQLYVGATRDQGIIQPPYGLRQLDRLSQENNALGPCIEAMVTNIDGTGYKFESDDEESEDDADDAQIEGLKAFFDEPWPGVTWTDTRKLVRRDLERTGNGYLEILRNAQDKVVMLRHIDAKMMRLLRLDDAVPVDVTVTRQGVEQKLTVMTRERRYCQLVNGVSLMYFKDFNSSRDLDKKTAVWAQKGQRLPANRRATEIMHFTVLPDAHTPYGIPRWVNQIPSVLGSRKAEEYNLEYFDNGGVPPVMVILQGGTLQADTRKAIEQKNAGPATKNNRLQVIEVEPVGGNLNGPTPQARVTVERFGGDRTTDSMFENYDQKCEERVRRSFRIPPLFLGQAADYNFATAFASYTVTEAQVFAPERELFDAMITMKLLPALGFDGYKHTSKPLVIEDPTLQLQGIEVISGMGDQVEPADVVQSINAITGLSLKVSDAAPKLQDKLDQAAAAANPTQTLDPNATHTMDAQGNIKAINAVPANPTGPPQIGAPNGKGGAPGAVSAPKPKSPIGGKVGTPKGMAAKKMEFDDGRALALHCMKALRKRDLGELAIGLQVVHSLDAAGQAQFSQFASELAFLDTSFDPTGLAALSTATMAAMAGHFDNLGNIT